MRDRREKANIKEGEVQNENTFKTGNNLYDSLRKNEET